MNLNDVARLIPATFREQLLSTNAIYKAIAIPSDPHMFMLFTVWATYVNPGGGLDRDCTKCLAEILGNYKRMQDIFVELHREEQLLNDL